MSWWKWLLLSLGVIALAVVAMLVGLIALAFQGIDFRDYLYVARPAWITSGWVAFWIAFVIMSQSLVPIAVAALYRPARQRAFDALCPPLSWRGVWLKVLAGGALALILQLFWVRYGPTPAAPYRLLEHVVYAVSRGGSFWPWFWLLTAAAAVVPAAEEILYRGLMQNMIRQRWGLWAGMLGSAALFGLAHGVANALPAALLGLYFSYQVERDRSLAGAITLHALHNLAAVLVMAAG